MTINTRNVMQQLGNAAYYLLISNNNILTMQIKLAYHIKKQYENNDNNITVFVGYGGVHGKDSEKRQNWQNQGEKEK